MEKYRKSDECLENLEEYPKDVKITSNNFNKFILKFFSKPVS
jgi:hypothetical protein